jgi:hypothetical protein
MSTTTLVATIAPARVSIVPRTAEVRPTTSDGTGTEKYFSRARKPTIDSELSTIHLPSGSAPCRLGAVLSSVSGGGAFRSLRARYA